MNRITVDIDGHKTSISLEPEFADALQELAAQRRVTVRSIVEDISASKKTENLSSAIRVFLFKHYKSRTK